MWTLELGSWCCCPGVTMRRSRFGLWHLVTTPCATRVSSDEVRVTCAKLGYDAFSQSRQGLLGRHGILYRCEMC